MERLASKGIQHCRNGSPLQRGLGGMLPWINTSREYKYSVHLRLFPFSSAQSQQQLFSIQKHRYQSTTATPIVRSPLQAFILEHHFLATHHCIDCGHAFQLLPVHLHRYARPRHRRPLSDPPGRSDYPSVRSSRNPWSLQTGLSL